MKFLAIVKDDYGFKIMQNLSLAGYVVTKLAILVDF